MDREKNMSKLYAVKMSNGDMYGIPAILIADNYAKYYETVCGESYQESFDTMMKWFDTGDYQFADWAKENMNWSEVESSAILIRSEKAKIDFQDEWVNGEHEYLHNYEGESNTGCNNIK